MGRELLPLSGKNQQQRTSADKDNGLGTTTAASNDAEDPSNSQATCQYETRERLVITKNVVVIGLAFMIHFTAFHGTSNLQSSVNSDKALGTTTLAVIYGSLILSNIFLPMTVIR